MEEWQRIVDGCEYATFFHAPDWYKAFSLTYPQWTIESRYIRFSDGVEVILPLMATGTARDLLKSYVSSPAWTYGGWVTANSLQRVHGNLLLKQIQKLSSLVWRENPYDPSLSGYDIPNAEEDFTHVLDLRKGYSEILRLWTRGHSSASRKARREGVEIKKGSSLADWQSYYEIYEDSRRRWGSKITSSYPFDLFRNLYELDTQKVKLWLAEYKGSYISGAVCFYTGHHVVYWHGASLEQFFPLRPANLLHAEIIRNAYETGYWWYDFNPSGGHEGVVNFKKRFGTEQRRTRVSEHSTVWFRGWMAAKRALKNFRFPPKLFHTPNGNATPPA